MAKRRVAILISGRGSNMRSLVESMAAADHPAEPVLVFSNDPEAEGLDYARSRGLKAQAISHRDFPKDRAAHERAVDAALTDAGAELVCLAGYMRILTPWFVERWRDRLINIHPSLLPSFKGLETHARALEAGVRWHGCTVHYVRAAMDDGPIIAQAAVPICEGDDADALSARVLAAEHQLYPHALRLVASGRAPVDAELVPQTGNPQLFVMNPPLETSR